MPRIGAKLSLTIAVFILNTAMIQADTYEQKLKLMQATIAVRINLQVPAPPLPTAPAMQEKAKRPVYEYHTSNCTPCTNADEAFSAFDPTKLSFTRVTSPKLLPNITPTGYPYYYWQARNGKWVGFEGWYGIAAIEKTLKERDELWWPHELSQFAKTYKGPMTGVHGGDFYAHLVDPSAPHRFKPWQLAGLSQQECAKIHGACHANLISPSHFPP